MSRRQPDWDLDRLRGEEAEQMVKATRCALLVGECEVKRDDQAATTGNVYVEYACQTSEGWKPSGIASTKATTWAFVLGHGCTIVCMPVWLLKIVARENGTTRECKVGSHPTKGVLLPVDKLVGLSLAALGRPAHDDQQRHRRAA